MQPDAAPELDALFSAAYEELRRLASSVRRRDPSLTLNPTALVHEAWLKLAESPPGALVSRLHFKRVAARAMRQVLVDAARRRIAGKRGGGALLVTLDEVVPAGGAAADVLALDAALREFERASPRQAAVIEHRFFGGLEMAEIAALLGVSEATVLRDWRAAKAWLAVALRRGA
jgi:RNA polymerase sigma factor (TIGR02999 family)